MIMMQLPKEFEETTKALMGEELYDTLLRGLGSEPPVSIRLNPLKPSADLFKGYGDAEKCISMKPVPWAKDGYYLSERPSFTLDPLFHAGAYYVQEDRQCSSISLSDS